MLKDLLKLSWPLYQQSGNLFRRALLNLFFEKMGRALLRVIISIAVSKTFGFTRARKNRLKLATELVFDKEALDC